jgi:hypothetical protein
VDKIIELQRRTIERHATASVLQAQRSGDVNIINKQAELIKLLQERSSLKVKMDEQDQDTNDKWV